MLRPWCRTVLWWWSLAVLLAAVWGGLPWLAGHGRQWLQKADARYAGRVLTDLRDRERVRLRSTPGAAARQAGWCVVKAEYVLNRYQPLKRDFVASPESVDALRAAAGRLLAAETASRVGAREIPEESGARLRAYLSEVDDTLQTYSVTVPSAYDPKTAWPLVVSMHGHGWYAPYQGHPAPAYAGAFCVAPQGRGATDYMEQGEVDVLRVIDEVCRDFTIDPDRIYLTGGSMGGTGSWNVGVHHADRFAAVFPICGNADSDAWSYRWGWNRGFAGRNDALRTWLQQAQSPRTFAGNLLNLPAYVVHGSGDTIVPPEHSRSMVAHLRELGCRVEFREFPECGHGGFPGSAISDGMGWMLSMVRNPYPPRVTWRAAHLRQGRAYWVQMLQMERPCEFADVEARVTGPNQVQVTTRNLLRLRLEQAPELVDLGRPLTVVCDGSRVLFPPRRDRQRGWVTLVRAGGRGWVDGERAPPPPALRKRPGFEGPISEVLLQPFVVVAGSRSPDPAVRDLWWGEARRFASEWRRRNGADCPLVRDVDCTDALMATRHLILLGGPADNAVTARLQRGLPLRDLAARAQSGLPVDTRTRTASAGLFAAPDAGLFLLYPNPAHPQRFVVVVAAGGPAGIYQAWQRFGNWFNWGVFDSTKYFDFAFYDARTAAPESFLLLGWFGTDWSLERGVWVRANPEVRRQFAPQAFPPYASGADCPGGQVRLADIRPTAIDQMRGAIGLGRTFFGRPLADSVGIRAPSTLEYDLAGRYRQLVTGVTLIDEIEDASCAARYDGEKLTMVVKGDGRVLAREDNLTWRAPVAALRADVTGVKTLRLEVAVAGGPAWLHGSAAWVRPILIP